MGFNITEKIIKKHLVEGYMTPGAEIAIKIDQTLTQDSTGTMAYLQFEAIGIDRVKTKKSVAYIDHNMLQSGPENADDHLYIQTVAKKYGIYFSKPGNGICHTINLERFGIPGDTLIGSDSHTPTAGGLGMLAFGAGGLDVAVAMAGGEYYIKMPGVIKVNLQGVLPPWVSAKDIILHLLKILTVKGGVGKVFEYGGEGVASISIPERATITNMGAELGATTSVFPSDQVTQKYLKAQKREQDFIELKADSDAVYDSIINIDLNSLEPLIACPHSPDNVVKVSEIKGLKVNQVAIGSCTNSSYEDLMTVAAILKDNKVHENVSLVVAPGSRQVLNMLASNGALATILSAGARVLECACGPCIGMGQSPSTDAVSLRTFNRNFEGRSGTKSAQVYLVSPQVAAVSAIRGVITDPRELGIENVIESPVEFSINDNMIVSPSKIGEQVEIVRGDNIKPFPLAKPVKDMIVGKVLIKLGDNITTDHIMPSNAKLLPYRSNVPYLSKFCLAPCDEEFSLKAANYGGGFILGGENYGQGSSREHAALAPLYLGVKGVIAKSFARIHRANLINNGILPMELDSKSDYDAISELQDITLNNIFEGIEKGYINAKDENNKEYTFKIVLSDRERGILRAGGLLNFIKGRMEE